MFPNALQTEYSRALCGHGSMRPVSERDPYGQMRSVIIFDSYYIYFCSTNGWNFRFENSTDSCDNDNHEENLHQYKRSRTCKTADPLASFEYVDR